jgi:hypothetical protein
MSRKERLRLFIRTQRKAAERRRLAALLNACGQGDNK